MPPSKQFNVSGRRKAHNNKKPNNNKVEDPLHNRDRPCSKRLQDVAEMIFDASSENAFAVIVRDYLLTTTRNNNAVTETRNHPESSSPPATKKKKRKKKKKSKGTITDANDALPDEEPVHEENADNEQMKPVETDASTPAVPPALPSDDTVNDQINFATAGEMCIPRDRLTTLWKEHLLNGNDDRTSTTTDDPVALRRSIHALETVTNRFSNNIPMTIQLVDSIAVPFLKQEMIERRLDRIVVNFMKQFDASAKASTAANQLGDFLDYCRDKDPFFVPLEHIQEAVREIECHACRKDAEMVLEQSQTTRQLDVNGATFETVLDNYTANDYETDSMYQIMEEGSLPLRDAPKWRFEAAQVETRKGWRLVRPSDQSPWEVSDLDFLFRHCLLTMGLSNERLFPQCGDAPVDIAVGTVDETVKGLFSSIEKVERWIKEARQQVDEGKPTDEVMDLNSFDHLKQADERCDLILNDLLGVAIKVASAANYVQSQYGCDPLQEQCEIEADVHWATRQSFLLWKIFLCCVESILEKMNEYEELRFATADHRGYLEEMYVSLQGRRFYFDFVRQKVKIVETAIAKIRDRLQYPTQLGNNSVNCSSPVTFVMRLFMEDAYFRSVGGKRRYPHLDIDRVFEDVMTVLREVVETVHAPNIDRIVNENRMRWSKLWRVAGALPECLNDQLNKASHKTRKWSTLYQDKLRGVCQEISDTLEFSQRCDGDGDCARVHSWRKGSCCCVEPLMASWSSLSTFSSDADPFHISPIIPRVVLERFLSESDIDTPSNRHDRCRGGNGASRLVSCLVGITLELVMGKFQEHQAQLAMNELLDAATEPKTASKTNAKKKKKRGAGLEREVVSVKEDTNLDAVNTNEVDLKESECKAGNSVASSPSSSQNDAHEGCDINAVATTATIPCGSGVSCYDDDIGVYDGSVFIRAETFLLGRLDALLISGEDIVFVS